MIAGIQPILDFTHESLRNKIVNNIKLIQKTQNLIEENYLKTIDRIHQYFHEAEKRFVDYLRINTEKHENYLSRTLSFERER